MKVLYISDSLGASHSRRGIFYYSAALTKALTQSKHDVTLVVERTRTQRALSSSGARLDRIGGFARKNLELLQIYRRLSVEDDQKLKSKKQLGAWLRLSRAAARIVPIFSLDVLWSMLWSSIGKARRGVVIDNEAQLFDYIPKDLYYLKAFASFLSIPAVYSYQVFSAYVGTPSQRVDASGYDVVIVDTPQRISLKRNKKTRLITVVHDLLPLTDIKLKDHATRIYSRRLADALSYGGEIVFVSQYTRQRWMALMPAIAHVKSRVVHPRTAFPKMLAESVRRSGQDYFVIVVSDEYRKNLEFVLSFFRMSQDLRLIVIGRSSRAVRNEFLGCSNIEFTGWCSEERKADYFAKSAGIIVASLAEGFGIPIIEGLSHGAPVLCSRIPVFEEVGRDYCVYFDPYDQDDLGNAIQVALTEQTGLRRRIAEDFNALKQRFSLDTLADAMIGSDAPYPATTTHADCELAVQL